MKRQLRSAFLAVGLLVLSPALLAEDHEGGQIPFHELPQEARELLAPFEKHWDRFKPSRQKRLLDRAQDSDPERRAQFKKRTEHLKNLSPEERKRLHRAKKHFDKKPAHERKELRKRFENMSPEERRRFNKKHEKFQGIPKHKQKEIRDKVRNMTAEERRQYLDELKAQKEK
jgi:hypothetical protein